MSLKAKLAPPFYDLDRDGVTFSLLSQFLFCRERTRVGLQGWTPTGENIGLVFGTLTHAVLHRIYERAQKGAKGRPSQKTIDIAIGDVETVWRVEHPMPSAEALDTFEKAVMLARAVLPVYVAYWFKDFTEIGWDRVESQFRIAITTRAGRSIFVNGKMDGAFHRPNRKAPWLFETKTKSRLGEKGSAALADILPFEWQVGIYLVALSELEQARPGGVLYNIIRRPELRQKQNESWDAFVRRVEDDVKARPDWYFLRMEMSVDAEDIARTREGLVDLVSDFVEWWEGRAGHYKNSGNCENKYGTCPALGICARKDFTRWFRRERPFMELEEW